MRGRERSGSLRRRLTTVAAFTLVKMVIAGAALAAFASTTSASHAITTGKLAAPTSLSASNGLCVILVSTRVNLSWSATSSSFADGYEVFRATQSGGPYSSRGTVSGVGTTTFSELVSFSTTYHYVVQAKRNTWRSSNSIQATVRSPSGLCLL